MSQGSERVGRGTDSGMRRFVGGAHRGAGVGLVLWGLRFFLLVDLVVQILQAKLGELAGDAKGRDGFDVNRMHVTELYEAVVNVAGVDGFAEAFLAEPDLLAD